MKAYLDFLSKENGAGFEFVSPPIDEVEYFGPGVGVGLRKGNDALLERINTALADMIKDGSLEKYSLKYFPFSIQPENWKGVD
jgi:polar amino acid transport system substrate-binding protein